MAGSGTYVCAFSGRRDYYQVPVALAQADMLDTFLTDAYFSKFAQSIEAWLPSPLASKLRFRHDNALPLDRVKCLWANVIEEHIRHRLGCAEWQTFARLDRKLSLAAAALARRAGSDLFLYQPYAWEAFTASYRHTPRKVMFQFHPHPDLERRILREDSARYNFFHYSYEEEMGEHVSEIIKQRNRDCWRYADLILCATEFTRHSLLEVGADAAKCKIVPYGIDLPAPSVQAQAPEAFHVLFVGSGTQRKGLHHLALAWQKAALPAGSRLTVVCRVIDKGLEAFVQSVPGVHLVHGLDETALQNLFKAASLFAMPSLVEGFGQVYLEAMAQGCPVLGTRNSCLPDMGLSDAIFLVEAGAIDQLAAQLEVLSYTLAGNNTVRAEARACAARWPWAQFRSGIRSALHDQASPSIAEHANDAAGFGRTA